MMECTGIFRCSIAGYLVTAVPCHKVFLNSGRVNFSKLGAGRSDRLPPGGGGNRAYRGGEPDFPKFKIGGVVRAGQESVPSARS